MTFAEASESLPELVATAEGFDVQGVEGIYGQLEFSPEDVPEDQIGQWTITEIHVFLPGKSARLAY